MLSWYSLTLIAAVFLGLYGIAKKHAVDENAVAPVLLANVSTAALIWSIPVAWEVLSGESDVGFGLCQLGAIEHLQLFLKSAMVGTSWMFAFVALKNLPISIATPIRATSPLWTILLAVSFANERPMVAQWVGMALIMVSFYAFSKVGRREGIHFRHNRAVWLMVAATLVSSFCGLYDKFLLQTVGIKPAVVQAWFSIYLVPVMIPMSLVWWFRDRQKTPFKWRWSIPMIAILLLIADYVYFVAVSDPEALISVISPLRRCSIVIPFLFGILALKEQNWRAKSVCIAILIVGAFLISVA
ncbi:DMT family transporter [Mariniblastus fucicola]|uniref:EamA-like transporter family protein n=1 Tax=Mariniblastus fucicola TaxID=980251 RepID=A0A5B9P4T7_9BACT|nr:DMT family transporter [Mariniblastus fucicola]QEG21617.1 EamA-like transporter family protein [Mariniblastus fucicola]